MRFIQAVLTLSVLTPNLQGAPNEQRPGVVILATGGTIAGEAPSPTDPGYEPGRLSVDILIDAVPPIKQLADVRGEQICNIASQDMSVALWLRLAKRVRDLLRSDKVNGVVITHGTDTMEETAFFLHLAVTSAKPIVLTGSMRPATALGADGALNLYNAVAVAADPEARGRGVLVVLNDVIHGARDVTKTHTTAPDTFQSRGRGPIGAVHFGSARYFRRPEKRHTAESTLSPEGATTLPRVDILYMYAGATPDLIEAVVEAGARGIVIAGTGNGNMPKPVIGALAAAAAKGVVCVRSSRVDTGFVDRNIEIDDDELGFVAAYDLSPQKARILLMAALRETPKPGRIQRLFAAY